MVGNRAALRCLWRNRTALRTGTRFAVPRPAFAPGVGASVGESTLNTVDIAAQKTVFCEPGPDGAYVELLTLDGISLTIDTGDLLHPTRTLIIIEGRRYLPLGTSVQIVAGEDGASVVTTVAVTAK